ncbi:hypothetical protein ACN9MB_13150 [Dyella kyungheensis]|uniref:hypothetical protein n=1 Tax=Dyella kyungheensis TaxID=1242174 RepID=UPI003CF9E90B
MSTIAYRSGVMASDSRAYGGSWRASPGTKAKIHRLDDGSLVGITSAIVGMPEKYIAWLRAGGRPEAWHGSDPDCRVLMVKPDGTLWVGMDSLHFSGPIDSEFYAIGSGDDFALGAMAMSADAARAIEIACQFDPHSGGPVQVQTL